MMAAFQRAGIRYIETGLQHVRDACFIIVGGVIMAWPG
jgi:hypothetical protein